MNPGVVVFYYTEGDYEAEAARLEQSLKRLGLFYCGQRVSKMNWLEAVHLRAEFLQFCRRNYPDQVLLSLDADAVVHSDPWSRIADGDWDIAYHTFQSHHRPPEPLPGTLVLRPTERTDRLLQRWESQNKATPSWPDRRTFAAALVRVGLVTAELPPEMCWIFDLSFQAYSYREPVIEHLQASREFRNPATACSTLAQARKQRLSVIEKGTL
jgi:hypothetical protein